MRRGKRTKEEKRKRRHVVWTLMKRNWFLYVMLLPAVIYLAIFNYAPMVGLQIAFKDYLPAKGMLKSPWVGLKWFTTFFGTLRFWDIMKNTLTLSAYSILAGFPLPIILALILNNVKSPLRKKFSQTITYMPHFISTVVLVSMISIFFSPGSGFINTLLKYVGGSGDVYI